MNPFHHPKAKHIRQFKFKRDFKQYKSYKRYLQIEFAYKCVFCREPSTYSPNLVFAVEHYKPKAKFPSLVTKYENLYYCCTGCNSRKKDYWPKAGQQRVVNPCDFVMASNLKYNKVSNEYDAKTPDGHFTAELLELNRSDLVEYRRTTLHTIDLISCKIRELEGRLSLILRKEREGSLDPQKAAAGKLFIQSEIDVATRSLNRHAGIVPNGTLTASQKRCLIP